MENVNIQKQKDKLAQWLMPVIPTTQKAEVGGLLEARSSQDQTGPQNEIQSLNKKDETVIREKTDYYNGMTAYQLLYSNQKCWKKNRIIYSKHPEKNNYHP